VLRLFLSLLDPNVDWCGYINAAHARRHTILCR
jgi:hypothetical protein